jgi:hypothetical protein
VGCFQVWAIKNKAAVVICVNIFIGVYVFFFLGMKWLGHVGVVFKLFLLACLSCTGGFHVAFIDVLRMYLD